MQEAWWRKSVSLFPRENPNSNEKLNVSKANGTFNKEIFAASAELSSHWPLLILFNFQLKD